MNYKVDVKIILKEVKPFSIVIGIMITFLKVLIEKNLIDGYTIEVDK